MFSGIVEEMGTVKGLTARKNLAILTVQAHKTLKGAELGASVCVNGVCLTIRGIKDRTFVFDMMRETLLKTTLGSLVQGQRVNLERALTAQSRFNGHFVSGHVDDMGRVEGKIIKKNYTELRIALKKDVAKYIVPKGSVCLDGVSLTVGWVTRKYFSVYLIPFTQKVTTLGTVRKGDKVNIETDILAKYILNGKPSSYSRKKLQKEIRSWN